MTLLLTIEAAAFLLGLLFGSFLNVCIARLPKGGSIVTPRSRCPDCNHQIRWYDNIPVLSWLLLNGRCRDCKAHISRQYPLVELAVGFWFMGVATYTYIPRLVIGFLRMPRRLHPSASGGIDLLTSFTIEKLTVAILGFLLIGLLVMDWQTHLLPDAFTFTGIATSFFLTCIRAFFLQGDEDQIVLNSTKQLRLRSPGSFASQGNIFLTGPEHLLGVWLISVVGAAAILLLIRAVYKALRHREGMGLGDVKLLAMIAGFLGFWPAVLTLFLGTLLATVYALFLVARGRAQAATALPFGSFLSAAGLVTALFGGPVIAFYGSLLR